MKILIGIMVGLTLTACAGGTETAAQLSAQVVRVEAERDRALAEAAYWQEQAVAVSEELNALRLGIHTCAPMDFPPWCVDQHMRLEEYDY